MRGEEREGKGGVKLVSDIFKNTANTANYALALHGAAMVSCGKVGPDIGSVGEG